VTALLKARRVTKTFSRGLTKRRSVLALDDFSLSIDSRQPLIIGMVGESGSGKTTAARILLGLESVTQGQMLYQGKDLRQLSRAEWRTFRRDVQAIFQDPFEVYNSFYKVDHVLNVVVAKFHLARSRSEGQALIEEALAAVGLRPEETLGRYPHQLSGGQRQRIMVARALLLRPKLIIADEPVSMIDASLRATVLANLNQLTQEFGISIIYITHDLTTAYQVSDDIIVLYSGSVMEAGDVELVVKEPRHPYTELLVGSIPLPDPKRRWGDEPPAVDSARQSRRQRGCKFAARCRYAFSVCFEQAPPLFRLDERRVAACYLYQDYASIRSEEVDKVLGQKSAASKMPPGQVEVGA
jgi:oligopeptide/dipeptide ABC transporter ATP-binding protein